MPDLVIRRAKEDDLPAMCALWFEMMNHHLAQDRRFAIAHDASTVFTNWVIELMKDPEIAYIAVAEERGAIQGYILGQIEMLPPVYAVQRIGVIRDVCVVQGARLQGLGSDMFRHSLGWFTNRKVGAIWVRVPSRSASAHQFWETLGFTSFTTIMRMEFPDST